MSADIRLERFVQRKQSRGRDFFYFRFARRGHPEFRRPYRTRSTKAPAPPTMPLGLSVLVSIPAI